VAANQPHLYLTPSTTEIAPSDTFEIVVGADTGDSIKSVFLWLDFDEDLIAYLDGTTGALFKGASFVDIRLDTINQNQMIYLYGAKLGYGQYVAAPGVFFILQFVALDSGNALFRVDSLLIYDHQLVRLTASADSLITIVTADTFPPVPIADFRVLEGSGQLHFSWRNPSDHDFRGTIVLRSENSFTDSVDLTQSVVFNGPASYFTDTGLVNGKFYYYTAFAYDEIPNYSTPVKLKAQAREELVYAYPNPFNPAEEAGHIRVILGNDDQIDVAIYDVIGNLVVNLVRRHPVTGGTALVLDWDGRNGRGDLVANGVYYVHLHSNLKQNWIEKIAVLR